MLIIQYKTTGENIHSFLKQGLIWIKLSYNFSKNISYICFKLKWNEQMKTWKNNITQTKLIFKKRYCSKILYLHSLLLINNKDNVNNNDIKALSHQAAVPQCVHGVVKLMESP